MNIKMLSEIQTHSGAMCMAYGSPGVGKTTSTLKSLPKPILYYSVDPRDVARTLTGNMTKSEMEGIEIREPDNFMDLFDDLNENRDSILGKFKSVVIDPFSYLSNVVLLGDIQQETFEAQVFTKTKRDLMNAVRTDEGGYGALANQLKRLCKVLGNSYAKAGIIVICICLSTDSPKWNKLLAAAPAFEGKAFSRDFPGYFDLIGLVEGRIDEAGAIVYPPRITFRSADESFVAKWSGDANGRTSGPLDWGKILNVVSKSTKEGK